MGCVSSKTKKKNLELEVETPDNKLAPIKPINEWQDCNGDIEDSQSLGDFMLFLMGNEGLKHIADKIFSASVSIFFPYHQPFTYYVIDMYSLANCRLVSRAFRDYLDNHMSMLHLQIKHFRDFRAQDTEDCGSCIENEPHKDWVEYGVFDYIENEVKDVSKLRTFLGLLRDIASDSSHMLIENPFRHLVNNHMHKELELLMNSPLPIYPEKGWDQWVDGEYEWPSYMFLYTCATACGECVQPFLDHLGDKFIDVNWTRNYSDKNCMHHAFENDFEKGKSGEYRFRPRVLPLLLRNRSEKGISMNALNWKGETIKERVTKKYIWEMQHYEDGDHYCVYAFGRDQHDVYEMLGINTDDYPYEETVLPSVSNGDTESDSNSSFHPFCSSAYSNSTSDSESNWETVSDTDPDT